MEPFARSGLSLACNNSRFHGNHSRVNVPGLLLRSLRQSLPLPVRPFRSTTYTRLAPCQAASTLQARCKIRNRLCPLLLWPPLPFGILTSLRIKAFNQIRSRPARLPNAPDLLSLPAAVSINRFGYGSSFQVRYAAGGLLFLKPLGTSFTMRLQEQFVNKIFVRQQTFPQHLFSLFGPNYGPEMEDCL